MPETFSTLERAMDRGRVYSSRAGRAVLLSAAPAAPAAPVFHAVPVVPATRATPAAAAARPKSFRFPLGSEGIPSPYRPVQGATGSVSLTHRLDGAYAVTGTLNGLGPISDPGVKPTLWLIYDLTVPADLAAADREALPRGTDLAGNAAGSVFTLDGNPPTYGATPNMLSIAVSPGTFTQAPDGAWRLDGVLNEETNQAYHPMVVLGPATMPYMNEPMPSGAVARLLTDLFMRTATIHPELNPRTQYMQRLAAIGRELRELDLPTYLDGEQYTRAAVTLEGIVRATPRLMPTRETCLALGTVREAE